MRDVGMADVKAINDASVPICRFSDPEYKLPCDINTSNLLGIEIQI